MADNLFENRVGEQNSEGHFAKMALRDAVEGPAGYVRELKFQPEELDRVRELVAEQWLARLRCQVPHQAEAYAKLGIARYHELRPLVDHATLWPKSERILPAEAVAEIRRTSLLGHLERAWGPFSISDEEKVGWEEVYWRIVRPGEPSDVGPLHADNWFWELGHGNTPRDVARIKVWVGIYCEPQRNGLRIVPGSHLRNWRYHGVEMQGTTKPRIDEDEAELNPQLVPLEPGEAIVFHDRLLHGGAFNQGRETRVSIEFTMFVSALSRVRT